MVRRNFSYLPKRFIMNRNEYFFYKLLSGAVGFQHIVIPQVHLDELAKPHTDKKSRIYSFRHINQKSVDFVICNIAGMHPILAIELDGNSHSRKDTIDRDKEVERILEEVHIPLLRFPNDHKLTVLDLREKIDQILAEQKPKK